MAIWLVRAGKHGEHEQQFLNDRRVYLTWGGLHADLTKLGSKPELRELLAKTYPAASKAKISNYTGQIWAFVSRIQPGDWVVLPSKQKGAIHVGEVKSKCLYGGASDGWDIHFREVDWFAQDIPRSNFDQDILYSLGAFMTVCKIQRNSAEKRIREMAQRQWKTTPRTDPPSDLNDDDQLEIESDETIDLERVARDQIAQLILARFKGHGMARLVNEILQAQGYTTYLSPEGPDKGIDILGALGAMGFGEPRICVQVKSGDSPLDRATLDQLIGAMQNVRATQGLLVSWGGFKSSIEREEANQFFQVRLWDQDDLIENLLENYERLDPQFRAELPLKQIWCAASIEE